MILDGKAIGAAIQEEISAKVRDIPGRKPCLVVVIVGEHPASQIYVDRKTKACVKAGITSIKKALPNTISEHDLLIEIDRLNQDQNVDGILVQLPLPPHIDPTKVTSQVSPDKDVDGFHPLNMGKLLIGDDTGFQPCTPLGIKVLLDRASIDVTGKHVVVVGRSNIVGKPIAVMLMQSLWGNATVTVVHSKTKNIKDFCKMADVLITALGHPHFITADMVKNGAVIVDVGINRINSPSSKNGYKIVGDVDFENVKDKCSFITPVPGGVGPMTIAMLLSNTLKSFFSKQK